MWNAVEKCENQWNAQLSRGIIIALPREISKSEYENLIRDYCMEQFASKGMIADFAVHDKGDGNPHAHIMLTMRAMDEKGKWLPKARKVYELDDNGERIRLPSGEWKSHKEYTVDWDDRKNAELWRSAWADIANRYLEKCGSDERLDLRSYERQGKEELPTVHLGASVSHMEAKGIRTELGDYNRQIIEHNTMLKKLKKKLAEISAWLAAAKETLAELNKKAAPQPTILDYVHSYNSLQKSGRGNWSVKGKQTASINDLKFTAEVYNWMAETGIYTLEDFNNMVNSAKEDFDKLNAKRKEIQRTETALRYLDTATELKAIFEKSKRGFTKAKEKYVSEHREEIEAYKKAMRYLRANRINVSDKAALEEKHIALKGEREEIENGLRQKHLDPILLGRIRHCIETVLESGETPEHQETVREKLDRESRKTNVEHIQQIER